MKITTKTRYALMILLTLNRYPKVTKNTSFAAAIGIGTSYPQILVAKLKKAGLLIVKKGPRGGSTLAKPLRSITLGEVMDAVKDNHKRTKNRNINSYPNESLEIDMFFDNAMDDLRATTLDRMGANYEA